MSRGRKPIELDKEKFQLVVADIEATQKPSNRSQLWKLVEASDWARSQQPRPLTSQVAYLKAKEMGLTIATPVGKKGVFERANGPKRSRVSLNLVSSVGVGVPDNFKKLVAKMEKGSLKAAVKLKCLDCSDWQMKEVRNCKVTGCPLFPVRPYQKG